MSFVDGFFTFHLEIANPERSLYTSTRIKTGKHPYESYKHLIARVLTYAHVFTPEITFSEGLYNPSQPALWEIDVIGTIRQWIEVGPVDLKNLRHAVKEHPQAQHRVYFYEPQQIQTFCNAMRGSKTNWIDLVRFYTFDSLALDSMTEILELTNRWGVTFSDTGLYVSAEPYNFYSEIEPLNMWSIYQQSINNQ